MWYPLLSEEHEGAIPRHGGHLSRWAMNPISMPLNAALATGGEEAERLIGRALRGRPWTVPAAIADPDR